MSYDIIMKATYAEIGKSTTFKMPYFGKTVALDFDGHALVEMINERGTMMPTGNAMDGRGSPITIEQDDITLEDVTFEEMGR